MTTASSAGLPPRDELGPVIPPGYGVLLALAFAAVPLAPADLAERLCVSLRTLERGLAQTLHCTPRQLILAAKMREAQGARVGEVADRLGFVNAFHFSRRFKEFYHVSPSELRPSGERPPAR